MTRTLTEPSSLDLTRPFTRADALAAGISPAMLRGSRFRRLFRNVYVHERIRANPFVRVQAALLIHPADAFASHLSAARVYRLPLPRRADEHVAVFAKADRRRRPGIKNHVAASGALVRVVRGVRVSAPAQAFVELASVLDLVDLVVVGDAMVRLGLATVEELDEHCAGLRDRFAAHARRAAAYIREGVDSAMESRLRMLLVLAGLPEPEVNHKIYDGRGRLRYRLDLSYPSLRLIVEYDGRQHRDDLGQWDSDIARREWFDHHGWMIVPVVARGVYRRPDETINRVYAALRARGCTTLPRTINEDWRPYFPVRG